MSLTKKIEKSVFGVWKYWTRNFDAVAQTRALSSPLHAGTLDLQKKSGASVDDEHVATGNISEIKPHSLRGRERSCAAWMLLHKGEDGAVKAISRFYLQLFKRRSLEGNRRQYRGGNARLSTSGCNAGATVEDVVEQGECVRSPHDDTRLRPLVDLPEILSRSGAE